MIKKSEVEGRGALYKRAVSKKGNCNEGNSPPDELTIDSNEALLPDEFGVTNTRNKYANGGDGLTYTLERYSKGASCWYKRNSTDDGKAGIRAYLTSQ